jgi:hypothetical protein
LGTEGPGGARFDLRRRVGVLQTNVTTCNAVEQLGKFFCAAAT